MSRRSESKARGYTFTQCTKFPNQRARFIDRLLRRRRRPFPLPEALQLYDSLSHTERRQQLPPVTPTVVLNFLEYAHSRTKNGPAA